MDAGAIERATQRLAAAAERRTDSAAVDAALERARSQVEALAEAASQLESTLPDRVGDAVREGVRAEALPVARQLAEVRGLMSSVIRRLERMDGDLLAERHARVDDLAVLVDLITSGWQSVAERLARLERRLDSGNGAAVYRIDERRLDNGPAYEQSS